MADSRATSTVLASPPLARAPTGRKPSNGSPPSASLADEGVRSPPRPADRFPLASRAGVPGPSLDALSKSSALPP
eukprot:2198399-Pleurochrysis_carterae.AAC.1